MPEQNHEGRTVLVTKINQQLSQFSTVVSIETKNNLSTRNVLAENILAGLLNRMEGWNLVNANRIRANYPAVDLVDTENRVAVQVTSTNTLEKIKHTLEEFEKNHLQNDYDRLYVVIITEDNPKESMTKRKLGSIFSGDTDIWNLSTLVGKLTDLRIPVLEDIHEYLTQDLGRYDHLGRYLYLPPRSAVVEGFVGREKELAEIRRRLDQGVKPVVLSGLGGMGKTELAAKFGREYSGGQVYFARFQGSFEATVRGMFLGVHPQPTQPPKESEQFEIVMDLLNRCTEQDLLILDNVDSTEKALPELMDDDVYRALNAMPLRLVLTTRFEHRSAVEIKPLDDQELCQIFRRHKAPATETEMLSLIRAVSGHTLTIDLIARTLADNWVPVSPKEMLDALHNNTLAEADFAEIDADYGGSPEQKQIYQHLRAVFSVAKIPAQDQSILHFATLLPEDGMDLRLFRTCLTKEQLNAFPNLGKRGWLMSDGQTLRIHPIVRLICRTELKPTEESCGAFLNSLWKQFDSKKHERARFSQMAEVFAAAVQIADSPEAKAQWLNHSGRLLLELTESRRAADLYEKHLPELERLLPTHSALATAYSNLGTAYGNLGDHKKELEYQLKDLAICEKVLPRSHPSLATSYNNVGTTYSDLGDYNKALEFNLKAQKILEMALPPEHPNLAASYNNVGSIYGALGDHNKALEYKLKALGIREAVLPANHPNLAQSYNNVGSTYGDLGDNKKALEYQLKALEIREAVLPANHPDIAQSYNNVGSTYGELRDHRKALEFKLKALEIFEAALPANHPALATSHNNVGRTYGDLGDHKKELEYQLKALEIWEKVLPPEHPSLATSYNNVGSTYSDLGDHNKGLEYQLKALEIREAVLPANHPDLALSYNNVGGTLGYLGDHKKALEFKLKALSIFEKALPPEHSYIAIAYQNVGFTYFKLGEMEKAMEYLRKGGYFD